MYNICLEYDMVTLSQKKERKEIKIRVSFMLERTTLKSFEVNIWH